MVVTNADYKLEILNFAVNHSIDNVLPKKAEAALNVILHKSNEVVWKVTTEIYTKSGYQIDFLNVREILNSRIEPLRRKIAREEKIRKEKECEERRIRADEKAEQTRIRDEQLQFWAKQEKIIKEQEAEEVRIRAKEEKFRIEIEAEQLRFQVRQGFIEEKNEVEKAIIKKEQTQLENFKKSYPSTAISTYKDLVRFTDIFSKIKNIVCELIETEKELITIETTMDELIPESRSDWLNKVQIGNSWSYNKGYSPDRDLNKVEFVLEVEEEFDIEIPDETVEELFSSNENVGHLVNLVMRELY